MKKRKVYVLVCISQKPKQWNAGCCGDRGGKHLLESFEAFTKERGLTEEIMIKKSSCINNCANGVSVRMLNDGVIYSKVKVEDIPEVIETHCINNTPILRLKQEYNPLSED